MCLPLRELATTPATRSGAYCCLYIYLGLLQHVHPRCSYWPTNEQFLLRFCCLLSLELPLWRSTPPFVVVVLPPNSTTLGMDINGHDDLPPALRANVAEPESLSQLAQQVGSASMTQTCTESWAHLASLLQPHRCLQLLPR